MAKAKALPPNLKETLLDAMSVAETSVEAADYLVTQFRQVLTDAKMLDQCGDILKKVEDFAKYTKFKLLSSSQPWLGQSPESSDFKNMQANMAIDAVKDLESLSVGVEDVTFDFAISDNSEFLRGCSLKGKALEATDKLFNSWLADKNLVSQGSTLYDANANGQIKRDAQDKPAKANPNEVRKLITDPEQGFSQYMETKGIKVTCHEQVFPTVQKGAQVQQAVKQAMNKTPEAAVSEEAAVEPQTTMRTGG
ncbi:hypothetical protein TUM19329_03470 [Legionella antarctica]|uniref:Substrate of the Dot/Icm secretion system n=1 Tax=Legionella antarctica TaxID=2708020 RepID=A0A6F8T1W6_9GAMM|nr:hypothetical protein [Legionella antarctica]BCA93986.1 hypothetical protein TUM19329_03470 [Legionella antarctica]